MTLFIDAYYNEQVTPSWEQGRAHAPLFLVHLFSGLPEALHHVFVVALELADPRQAPLQLQVPHASQSLTCAPIQAFMSD